jgi:hypothetical protein
MEYYERFERISEEKWLSQDKAKCTVNFASPNPFMGKPAMSLDERVSFIMGRLKKFGVRGYSEQYVRQLLSENKRQTK